MSTSWGLLWVRNFIMCLWTALVLSFRGADFAEFCYGRLVTPSCTSFRVPVILSSRVIHSSCCLDGRFGHITYSLLGFRRTVWISKIKSKFSLRCWVGMCYLHFTFLNNSINFFLLTSSACMQRFLIFPNKRSSLGCKTNGDAACFFSNLPFGLKALLLGQAVLHTKIELKFSTVMDK